MRVVILSFGGGIEVTKDFKQFCTAHGLIKCPSLYVTHLQTHDKVTCSDTMKLQNLMDIEQFAWCAADITLAVTTYDVPGLVRGLSYIISKKPDCVYCSWRIPETFLRTGALVLLDLFFRFIIDNDITLYFPMFSDYRLK